MEFNGRISQVLPARTGISQQTGKEWTVQPFIFEYFEHEHDRYPDRVFLEALDVKQALKVVEGAEVCVGFGHSVREWTNKDGVVQYYNQLRVYKLELIRMPGDKPKEPTIQPPLSPAPTPETPKETPADGSDLPF